jgi:hypothetical protein
MDMPPSSFCAEHADGGGSNEGAANAGQCEATYESLGANSCGMGLTCCQSTTTSSSSVSASSSSSSIPYPAGSYTCIVFLDGQNVGESDFDIVYPNGADAPSLGSLGCAGVNASKCYCPVPPPVNGTPCFGWVPEGAECPAYVGDSTCTCMPTGVWSCLE